MPFLLKRSVLDVNVFLENKGFELVGAIGFEPTTYGTQNHTEVQKYVPVLPQAHINKQAKIFFII